MANPKPETRMTIEIRMPPIRHFLAFELHSVFELRHFLMRASALTFSRLGVSFSEAESHV
jgi:hypothetical protein